uniref:Miro domain-containing protein n=1 Tax=Globodera rostochiensis TaxID=31243 RepID=A0A914GU30_GLORO
MPRKFQNDVKLSWAGDHRFHIKMIVSEHHQTFSKHISENEEASTAEAEVRILLVGDCNVGKTSLIDVLVCDRFSDEVPASIGTVQFPRKFSEDGVLTQIKDYSERVQKDHEELIAMIKEANVICVVYSVDDLSSEERVASYWLPLIQKTHGGANHNCSVLLAANKSDDMNGGAHIEKMAPIMNDYLEIETVVECSAKFSKNVPEIFYYAQKAVIYPFRPLFSVEKRELSMKCQKAMTRIFKLCDRNNDGLLSDDELKKYQMVSFGVPLTSAAVGDVKKLISECDPDMVAMTPFGLQDYLLPKILIPNGSSLEPSNECLYFIQNLFKKHDEDCDECLSAAELQSLFSVCPTNPWTDEMLNSVEQNRDVRRWSTWHILGSMSNMTVRSTKRRVFKCNVIGPRNAGKTVFCRSFVGKNIVEVERLGKKQLSPYAINSVLVRSESKHLLLQEIDVDSRSDLLSSQEINAADVVCLLYDSTDPNSFAYCAELYLRNFHRMKLPCLFVTTKFDQYEVEQDFAYQPTEFCNMHQLPKPYYFSGNDVGNPSSEVFSILATMAAYPHLKRLFYL